MGREKAAVAGCSILMVCVVHPKVTYPSELGLPANLVKRRSPQKQASSLGSPVVVTKLVGVLVPSPTSVSHTILLRAWGGSGLPTRLSLFLP